MPLHGATHGSPTIIMPFISIACCSQLSLGSDVVATRWFAAGCRLWRCKRRQRWRHKERATAPRTAPPRIRQPPAPASLRAARSHHHASRQGALNMNHGEIDRFHKFVGSIDVDHDDHVSRKEFVDTLDLKPKAMAQRLFEVMVVEHSGQEHRKGKNGENTQPLHVAEFFVGIFHFGTRTDKLVHEDFFNIYCSHSISHHGKTKKVMDNKDLHSMIKDMMGEAYLKGDVTTLLNRQIAKSLKWLLCCVSPEGLCSSQFRYGSHGRRYRHR